MTAVTVFNRFRQGGMFVKNLRPVLTERGKIKIGAKRELRKGSGGNEFQLPQKLGHFVITTLDRGKDGNFIRDSEIHQLLGAKPTSIPVRLIFDEIDMNLQTRYVAFQGRNIWCHGDGEAAVREGHERECPCPNLERGYDEARDKLGPVCKINGRLQVIIDGAPGVGGVWVFRTTSWNTVQGLVSSMALIANITGGRLAGVPLMLTVRPKQATDPQGRQQTIYVVGIEYRGTIEELRERAYQAALADAQQGERLDRVREEAAKMLSAPVVSPDEETDVVEEFYPEQAMVAYSAKPARETVVKADPAEESGLIAVYDQFGEEFQIQPGEIEAWFRDRVAECDAEQLKALAEVNAGTLPPAIVDVLEQALGARKIEAFLKRDSLVLPMRNGVVSWANRVEAIIPAVHSVDLLDKLAMDNSENFERVRDADESLAIRLNNLLTSRRIVLQDMEASE